MTTIKELTTFLETIAPLPYQEPYDNAGLIVGDNSQEITNVLVSLDCTEAVVEEAINTNCNLIVAHHPIVFKGLKKLNGKNYVERTVIKAIKNDVAIYAIHTNLDNVLKGVNSMIASKLGLQDIKILSPKNENEEVGSGAVGYLEKPMSSIVFLNYLKQKMNLKIIKHTDFVSDTVHKIAVCGGSGSFLLGHAIASSADVFITADYKYHEFFDAEDHLMICDIGHYESEVCTKELLCGFLSEKFTTFAVVLSKVNTNPVNYFY